MNFGGLIGVNVDGVVEVEDDVFDEGIDVGWNFFICFVLGMGFMVNCLIEDFVVLVVVCWCFY